MVMGVAGAGKSVVGAALAERLGRRFVEGDDLHPPGNVAKMRWGVPLDDRDRMPWLDAVAEVLAQDPTVVVSCSALRRRYRDRLRAGAPRTVVLHVAVPLDVAEERAVRRRGHFLPPSLVPSQLAELEPLQADEAGVTVDGTLPLPLVVTSALEALGYDGNNSTPV